MLVLTSHQLSTFDRSRREKLSERFRVQVHAIPEFAQLADTESAWVRWWVRVAETARGNGAISPKAVSAHAMFSLWFGQAYFRDPRTHWLADLLAAPDGSLDYRRLGVELDDVLEMAALAMEVSAGPHLQAALMALDALVVQLSSSAAPEWSVSHAQDVLRALYPMRFDDYEPQALPWLISAVEKVSTQFLHGAAVQWPLLLSVYFFGVDAWRDPALPMLWRTPAVATAMSTAEMLLALQRQARFTRGLPGQPPGS